MRFLTAKKLSYVILTISLCSFLSSSAQEFQLIQEFTTKGNAIATDNFGNLYVYGDYKIVKYNNEGVKLNEFEDYQSGKISYVDASNPLKTLLYYEDFMVMKVLDKTLSELLSYSLNKFNLYSINAIAYSRDDNFWFFDNVNFKLKKFDENGGLMYESENFNMLFDTTVQPIQIINFGSDLYVNDPHQGVFIFDRFGTYQKKIPLTNIKSIQILQNKIIYFKDGDLYSYNRKDFSNNVVSLDKLDKEIIAVQIQKDRLYVLSKNKVSIYKIVS